MFSTSEHHSELDKHSSASEQMNSGRSSLSMSMLMGVSDLRPALPQMGMLLVLLEALHHADAHTHRVCADRQHQGAQLHIKLHCRGCIWRVNTR